MFDIQKLEIKAILAGVVLLIIAGLGTGLYICHKKYVAALVTNGDLKNQNNEYLATIKADSDANAKLAADSKAREEAANAAESAARKQSLVFQKKANDILAEQAQYPTDLCKSADALFNDYIVEKIK